ncbi:hypothetical protein TUM4644_04370 [Shewanella colwelliana]|nr:hypothetical protein TUM4644_04370 [Shewanella colwelliana]
MADYRRALGVQTPKIGYLLSPTNKCNACHRFILNLRNGYQKDKLNVSKCNNSWLLCLPSAPHNPSKWMRSAGSVHLCTESNNKNKSDIIDGYI